jgi:hypothetical protein
MPLAIEIVVLGNGSVVANRAGVQLLQHSTDIAVSLLNKCTILIDQTVYMLHLLFIYC